MSEIKYKAKQLVKLLKEKNLKISTAESCTGGLLSSAITSVPGASEVFEYGFVTYSEDAKMKILSVNRDILNIFSVYSNETASAMAAGAAEKSGSDLALSITGVAGPGDDGEHKAGQVFTGIFFRGENEISGGSSREYFFEGTRDEIREQAVDAALLTAIKMLEKDE